MMISKLDASCYAMDIEVHKSFMHREEVYVMVKHGEDRCQVRMVLAINDEGWYFVSHEVENFNSYADVRPFSLT